jgi:hypothetical protein
MQSQATERPHTAGFTRALHRSAFAKLGTGTAVECRRNVGLTKGVIVNIENYC